MFLVTKKLKGLPQKVQTVNQRQFLCRLPNPNSQLAQTLRRIHTTCESLSFFFRSPRPLWTWCFHIYKSDNSP